MLDLLDALILTGGAGDVNPALYGQERHPETGPIQDERDAYELALARGAVERGIPTLGICRGMEILNVVYGGSIEQHLPDMLGHEEHRHTPAPTPTTRCAWPPARSPPARPDPRAHRSSRTTTRA